VMEEGQLKKRIKDFILRYSPGLTADDVLFEFIDKEVLDEVRKEFPLTPKYDGDNMTEFWAKLATERLDWANKWFGSMKWLGEVKKE